MRSEGTQQSNVPRLTKLEFLRFEGNSSFWVLFAVIHRLGLSSLVSRVSKKNKSLDIFRFLSIYSAT